MTREQFLIGMKILWSVGGAKPDDETLEIWFRMLRGSDPYLFALAIDELAKNKSGEELRGANLVNAIREGMKSHAGKLEMKRWRLSLPSQEPLNQHEIKYLTGQTKMPQLQAFDPIGTIMAAARYPKPDEKEKQA